MNLFHDAAIHYDDWVNVNPGDRVSVKRSGDIARPGTVDEIAEDASVFWVWLDNGHGRILIYENDESVVWKMT